MVAGDKVDSKILIEIKSLNCEIINKVNKKNTENPLGLTQIKIINHLIENKITYQKDLEKKLGLTRATISCVLKTMEKNKIINRISNELDGRSKQIVLNEKIKNKLKGNINEIKKIDNVITKDIDDKELEIFFNVINKMKENLRRDENV